LTAQTALPNTFTVSARDVALPDKCQPGRKATAHLSGNAVYRPAASAPSGVESVSYSHSKDELQSQLDISRLVRLTSHLAISAAGWVDIRAAKPYAVEGVEELRPKL